MFLEGKHVQNYTQKQKSLPHAQKTCLQVWTHTHTNTHSPWKNLAYYPYCITAATFLESTAPPPCWVTAKETMNELEGGERYYKPQHGCVCVVWGHSTRRHSCRICLCGSHIHRPSGWREAGLLTLIITIIISRWQIISSLTRTRCSPQAGLNFVITAISAKVNADNQISLCSTCQSCTSAGGSRHLLM